jgi:hypothetical protein
VALAPGQRHTNPGPDFLSIIQLVPFRFRILFFLNARHDGVLDLSFIIILLYLPESYRALTNLNKNTETRIKSFLVCRKAIISKYPNQNAITANKTD